MRRWVCLPRRPRGIFRAPAGARQGRSAWGSFRNTTCPDGALVELAHPEVEVGLEVLDRPVELLAEGDAIELVEHGLVEALDDAVGLRALGLGSGMVDVLDREIELVFWPQAGRSPSPPRPPRSRCLASSSRPALARMIFWSLVMTVSPGASVAGAAQPRPAPPPPRLPSVFGNTVRQIKLKLSQIQGCRILISSLLQWGETCYQNCPFKSPGNYARASSPGVTVHGSRQVATSSLARTDRPRNDRTRTSSARRVRDMRGSRSRGTRRKKVGARRSRTRRR